MSATPKNDRAEFGASQGGEGGQAAAANQDETRHDLIGKVPFGGRLPAMAFLVAASLVGLLLLVLVTTPLNR